MGRTDFRQVSFSCRRALGELNTNKKPTLIRDRAFTEGKKIRNHFTNSHQQIYDGHREFFLILKDTKKGIKYFSRDTKKSRVSK